MSIFSSLYIGMSGMRTHEGAIGVIGNNIANLNTIGFKSSRTVFADLLSQSVLGTAGMSQQGLGASVASVQRMVTQGALLGTNIATDIAVNGDGLFIVEDGAGDRYYTRNGQFQVDDQGYMTTIEGMRLQGRPADAAGVLQGGLGDLRINDANTPPRATTELQLINNLSASDAVTPAGFDINSPTTTSSFQQSVTVYDSLGAAHQVDIYYTQTAAGEWSWNAVVPQDDLDGQGGTNLQIIASGNLTFGPNGTLSAGSPTNPFTVTFANASPQDITFDFGEIGDLNGSTGFGTPSANSFTEQDGFGPGTLSFIEIDPEGNITGTFTNGQERLLGQVALARFTAPAELNALGQNLFAETINSGEPAIGQPGTGGRGELFAGSLEQSNVDLTNEFTQLILAQRGFQASSRTITTADEMLVEAVNLKR